MIFNFKLSSLNLPLSMTKRDMAELKFKFYVMKNISGISMVIFLHGERCFLVLIHSEMFTLFFT